MKKILIVNANYYNNITNKLVLSSFKILKKENYYIYDKGSEYLKYQ